MIAENPLLPIIIIIITTTIITIQFCSKEVWTKIKNIYIILINKNMRKDNNIDHVVKVP